MMTRNIRKEEIVWLYELGERNFKRQNLRGKSFRGEDLSGTDFTGSDIRGADFTNAVLTDACFVNVTAGLQKRQAIFLLVMLISLALLLGVAAGLVGTLTEARFFAGQQADLAHLAWVTPVLTITFIVVSLVRDMRLGFVIFGFALLAATMVAFVSSAAIPIMGSIALVITVDALITSATAAVSILMLAAALAFRIVVALGVAFAFVVAVALTLALTAAFASSDIALISIASTTTVVSLILPLSGYMAWRTLKNRRKHIITWELANFLATRWGTSFRGCDLTNADFTRAILKSTDFSQADLTNTCWDRTIWRGNSVK